MSGVSFVLFFCIQTLIDIKWHGMIVLILVTTVLADD